MVGIYLCMQEHSNLHPIVSGLISIRNMSGPALFYGPHQLNSSWGSKILRTVRTGPYKNLPLHAPVQGGRGSSRIGTHRIDRALLPDSILHRNGWEL
jgi:hypothetical protein